MRKNSSVEKGDIFEKEVFDMFKKLLDNDESFLNSKYSKIYWKKQYYSDIRKDTIEVDISIETFQKETFQKETSPYSLLTIIECKNYNKGVPVNDIEEFDSKLKQIGEHNTKGIIVTSSSFQKATINFAINKGIGLIRINKDKPCEYINYRTIKRQNILSIDEYKLIDSNTNLEDIEFLALYGKKQFESIPNLLIELGIINEYFIKPSNIKVPFLTEEQINIEINKLPLHKFYIDDKLEDKDICSVLSSIYNVNFNFDNELNIQKGVLGKITFNPLEIFVTKELKKEICRWRFTLAHEIGHLVLHLNILTEYLDEYSDDIQSTLFSQNYPIHYNKNLEIQANMFASILLLPTIPFLKFVNKYFKQESVTRGYLYFDKQSCNIKLVTRLLSEIQLNFGVSKEAAKYRLFYFKLLKEPKNYSQQNVFKL